MDRTRHVIYIPGLGDGSSHGQDVALRCWKVYGLIVHYHAVGWSDGELFDRKLKRIIDLIDSLNAPNVTLSLVGTSAGASAVLNAFVKRKTAIASVVCICGKIQNPQTISQDTFHHNPAFEGSMKLLSDSLKQLTNLEREKILSIHPLWDNKVPIMDTLIERTTEATIPTVGHNISIGYALTIGSFHINRFIQRS